MNTGVDLFLDKFLLPPKSDSAKATTERIRYWIDVANHPEQFVKDDLSPYAISAKRRTARQNLRRLLKKYGQVAATLMHEAEGSK